MTIYLAPLAKKTNEVISQETPTKFREKYEPLENKAGALHKFTINSPENPPNFKPPDGDLEKGMNYLMFYDNTTYHIHDSVNEKYLEKFSQKVPETEAWKAAQVTFEYGSEFNSDDDSDCSEQQRGHCDIICDGCTGVYYLGEIPEQDGDSPSGQDASETDNVNEDVEIFQMDES